MSSAMLARSLLCNTPAEFPQVLLQATELAASSGAELYLLFTGAKGASGQSWCPDCVRAEPLIQQVLSKHAEPHVVVTCDVEREPYRSQDYPYRVDKTILLRCVPTLIKWEGGRCSARLNDIQCQSVAALEEFFESS